MFNKRHKKYKTITPASLGESMSLYADWIKNYSSLSPENVFEIGANMAQDAEYLRNIFDIKSSKVWVFEPHPDLYKYIKNNFKFRSFKLAVSNRTGSSNMNFINLEKHSNSGISSLLTHKDVSNSNFDTSEVKTMRMDDFIEKHNIKSIDFLKIDVEGHTYEVLKGFGTSISKVKAIQVEAEHYEHWSGQKLWPDIYNFLSKHMEMVYFERHLTQSDSLWIRKKYIKNHNDI